MNIPKLNCFVSPNEIGSESNNHSDLVELKNKNDLKVGNLQTKINKSVVLLLMGALVLPACQSPQEKPERHSSALIVRESLEKAEIEKILRNPKLYADDFIFYAKDLKMVLNDEYYPLLKEVVQSCPSGFFVNIQSLESTLTEKQILSLASEAGKKEPQLFFSLAKDLAQSLSPEDFLNLTKDLANQYPRDFINSLLEFKSMIGEQEVKNILIRIIRKHPEVFLDNLIYEKEMKIILGEEAFFSNLERAMLKSPSGLLKNTHQLRSMMTDNKLIVLVFKAAKEEPETFFEKISSLKELMGRDLIPLMQYILNRHPRLIFKNYQDLSLVIPRTDLRHLIEIAIPKAWPLFLEEANNLEPIMSTPRVVFYLKKAAHKVPKRFLEEAENFQNLLGTEYRET
ncbi:MAG TPA: hypothetical protein PLQ36_01250, partial [Candidatus Gracilibacteria bacterium]|nr:hypothetical protein [Candidatus Gracilibacteria bacterium]